MVKAAVFLLASPTQTLKTLLDLIGASGAAVLGRE